MFQVGHAPHILVFAPEEDPELTVLQYTRSFEQNDELGLNDMKVEGYQEE